MFPDVDEPYIGMMRDLRQSIDLAGNTQRQTGFVEEDVAAAGGRGYARVEKRRWSEMVRVGASQAK